MIQQSLTGLNFIKQWESCKLSPYLDSAGIPTIGYGSTHYEDGQPVHITDDSITQSRADALLSHECAKVVYSIGRLVSGTTRLTQGQVDALIAFTYNVGVTGFASSTILKNINKCIEVTVDLFTRWDKVHDPRTGELHEVQGLLNRRRAEYVLYSS